MPQIRIKNVSEELALAKKLFVNKDNQNISPRDKIKEKPNNIAIYTKKQARIKDRLLSFETI